MNSENSVTCQVYHSFEELSSFREMWDSFVEKNGSDIFLTYDWCRIWWRYYGAGRKLEIYIFRNKQEIVGLIPLFSGRIWIGPVFIDSVNVVGADHRMAQFLLPIQPDFMEPVIHKLILIITRKKWDVLYLGPLAGLCSYTDQLKNTVNEALTGDYKISVKLKDKQIYFHLAETWKKQLSKMSKSNPKNIARSYKNLEKSDKSLAPTIKKEIINAENFENNYENFVIMHNTYWRKHGKSGHFGDWPDSIAFHHEMAQTQLLRNRLKLVKISVNDQCIGYEYDYWFGNKCYELVAARNDDLFTGVSVGKINYSEKMKLIIENNIALLDSMRGKYDYKLKYGGKVYDIKGIQIVYNTVSCRIRFSMFCSFASLLHLFYYRLWYCRLAPSLPLERRPLWRLWIRTTLFAD